jgi:hypothetical protein
VAFKKNQKVGKVLTLGGVRTISFGHRVVSVSSKGLKIELNESDRHYMFNKNGIGCSDLDFCGSNWIVSEEDGIDLVESKHVSLDGGEVLPTTKPAKKGKK